MITEDRIVKILYAAWICELRKNKDPDYELKVALIKEIMNRFGVEGMEDFDEYVENKWKNHYLVRFDNV